ncbi:unnamed protein product [Arabis nemorensis]|uniref:Uncharacterized protein n=1 Tax=Arabis nemorensis TaxID=586526 RepID=A0A565BIL5_9BRAS|nr:unnamed protein product [Arabis nemorensis]
MPITQASETIFSRKRGRSKDRRSEKSQNRSCGEDLSLATVEGSGTAVDEAEQKEEEEAIPGIYGFGYSFKDVRACTDLFSLIQPSDRLKLPKVNHLVQRDAYINWSGSLMQAVCSTNHLVTLYERKMNKSFDRVLKLQGQVDSMKSASDELNSKAEQTMLRNRELEEKIVAVETEKESLKAWADKEIAQLKEATALAVVEVVAACRVRNQARLGKLKRYCQDMEEVNRLSSLANQSGGIKAYQGGRRSDLDGEL